MNCPKHFQPIGKLSQWHFVPMPYVPKISENPEICPKHQMSQTPFVPKAKCPNYILSQYPLFPRILVPIALCFIVLWLNSHFNQSCHCYSSHSAFCPNDKIFLGELSQTPSDLRKIVPMTFCPNTFCPNAYVSQKKVNCPKCQKSQLHFVPNAKSPNYILSQKQKVPTTFSPKI